MSRSTFASAALALGFLFAPLQSPAAQQRVAAPVDWVKIHRYAHLSSMAHVSDSLLRAAYPGLEVAGRELPDVAGRVIVVTDHARRVHWVSARGTANMHNVLMDAQSIARQDAKAGVRLHRGFEKYAAAAYASVRPLLRPGYRVNLTGHSLGGAAAVILMMYLRADGVQIGEVVTFGQPKVTDAHGVARYADAPITRVVDCRDPIPLTPPHGLMSALHGAFRHFGREIILFDGPLHSVLPEHVAERADVTSFWHSLPHVEAHDHKLANYLKRIETKLTGARAVSFRPGAPHACSAAAS